MVSDRPQPLQADETLSRYLQKEKIRRSDNTVKSNAFMPSGNSRSVSVYRADYMLDAEIKQAIDRLTISRPVIGVTRLTPKTVRSINDSGNPLDVVPEETNFRWHADIIGFPLDRAKTKLLAQKLAAIASLVEML